MAEAPFQIQDTLRFVLAFILHMFPEPLPPWLKIQT